MNTSRAPSDPRKSPFISAQNIRAHWGEIIAWTAAIASGIMILIGIYLLAANATVTSWNAVAAFMFGGTLSAFAGWRLGEKDARDQSGRRIAELQRRIRYEHDLLRLVADNQPRMIAILNAEGRYIFANSEAATQVGMEVDEIMGHSLEQVLGPRRARRLQGRLREAREEKAPIVTLDRIDMGGALQFLQTYHIPLPSSPMMTGAVLVTEDDITGVMIERERRERMLRQILDTLVAVVDRRDPYAAGHSLRVGQIARAIAEEMGLTDSECETAQIAGLLMNFGKVLVPRAILTKNTPLLPDELKQVREAILNSADILSLIEFELPVVPTLRQILEHYDGTGAPEGRRGDDILTTARITSVANAFVALVSPRAHRPGIAASDAISSLMKNMDTLYDRKIVLALANYVENRDGKPEWVVGSESVAPSSLPQTPPPQIIG